MITRLIWATTVYGPRCPLSAKRLINLISLFQKYSACKCLIHCDLVKPYDIIEHGQHCSSNGLLPVWCQTNTDFLLIKPWETNCVEIRNKILLKMFAKEQHFCSGHDVLNLIKISQNRSHSFNRFNSLWPSKTLRGFRTCCLMAPSHYLNQC